MAGQNGHKARVWIVAIFLLGLYLGLLGRLYVIQGMDQGRFQDLAQSQHFVQVTKPERRGTILDCRGRPLACSAQVPSVFADPRQIDDPEATAHRLAEFLGLDAALLLSRLQQPMGLVCIKRNMPPEQIARLKGHPALLELGEALEFRDSALYARPAKVTDPEAAAAALAPLLNRDAEELRTDLDGLRQFVWVKRKVSEQDARRVMAAGLEGVGILPEYKRSYPQGELAGQLIGFVGMDEEGLEGIERTCGGLLAPTPGRAKLQRDAAGRYIAVSDAVLHPPQPGADLELTVDSVIQGYVEAALDEVCDLWGPKGGAFAVVVDPRTGSVLAAASSPGYDPNKYTEYEPADLKRRARARYIVDWMEPGSIMKPFVFAGAFNERLITEETPIFCENGMWLIGGTRRFRDVHAYGTMPASLVLIKSSNIGTAKIGQRLGPERLYEYLTRFGFGRPTGFEMPGENPGRLRPPSRWTSFSLPSISVGQEVCVTSMQMAMAYSALANDGLLLHPRLIQRVRRADGTWIERPTKVVHRAVPASVAQRVRRLLCGVVEEGTGKAARNPAYTIGGKTGTAQKPVVGGFSRTQVICSFVGMAPIENPRLVVVVSVDEPTKSAGGRFYGGTVAAPAAGQIIKQTLAYWGVPPDKPQALVRLGYGGDRPKGTP
ncbi:MAG TPA: penicillin-binding protein 2 [Planctomycetota bacterium]|nr:penicillin-binding protein 2 [Planctomycetota bacterium]HRR80356.1 penicillin-binding protein 2 [Planctomycetota bacterium]HRT94152.1 penicillin-binding protein 2 [Planctomycetota bacterium]